MAAPSEDQPTVEETQIVFRPGKKRKTYRQRTDDVNETIAPSAPVDSSTTKDVSALIDEVRGEVEAQTSVAEALRLRNARKARLRGVGFSAHTASTDPQNEETSLVVCGVSPEAPPADLGGMRRFAPQTGLVGEVVNKHMMEYVESELAKRHSNPSQTAASASSNLESRTHPNAAPRIPAPAVAGAVLGSSTTQGKLMEIDLGDEVRDRNVALTDRARRRLEGEAVDDDEGDAVRSRRARPGRDGKAWRSKNRRTSEDIKRDQLVEEILRENRLDVYENPTSLSTNLAASSGGTLDDDGAADERLAEEFRREFYDAMQQRHQKKRKAAPAPANRPGARKADDEVLRGPKLGGSRNVRAAMRDILLKKEKEAAKR